MSVPRLINPAFVFQGMELTEVLEAKTNLGQRQGAGTVGDFKCAGQR